MKKYTFILAILLLSIAFVSCEKEEISVCSCTTTVTEEDGTILSVVGSVQETPLTGNCADLFSSVTDPMTGINTLTNCDY